GGPVAQLRPNPERIPHQEAILRRGTSAVRLGGERDHGTCFLGGGQAGLQGGVRTELTATVDSKGHRTDALDVELPRAARPHLNAMFTGLGRGGVPFVDVRSVPIAVQGPGSAWRADVEPV